MQKYWLGALTHLRGYPMTLNGMAAFIIATASLSGVLAEAGTSCPELIQLRNAGTAALKEAMRAPAPERCVALNQAALAAEKTLRYANNNREACDISVPSLNQVEGYHREAVQARDNVCAGRPLQAYPADIIQR
jgi:hypothetical protein